MKRHQKGFTIIELMITVGIVALLAMFAVPAYQNYSLRTQASEGLALTGGLKLMMSDHFNRFGSFPANNGAATAIQVGIQAANTYTGNNVSQIAVSSPAANTGRLTITYQGAAPLNGLTLFVDGVSNGGRITWSCNGGTIAGTTFAPC